MHPVTILKIVMHNVRYHVIIQIINKLNEPKGKYVQLLSNLVLCSLFFCLLFVRTLIIVIK